MTMRQGSSLDAEYITEQLSPLCDVKESPQIIEKLKNLLLPTDNCI
jgi:hypothetical protein